MRSLCYCILLWGIALCALASCSNEEKIVPSFNITTSDGEALNHSSITFTSEGGSAAINITSNSQWQIECEAEWVDISPREGQGNGSVVITADATTAARSAVAVAYLSDYKQMSRSFNIIQYAPSNADDQPDNGEDNPTDDPNEDGGEDNPTDNPNDDGNEDKPTDDPNDEGGEDNGEDKPTDNPNDEGGEDNGEDKPTDDPNEEGGNDKPTDKPNDNEGENNGEDKPTDNPNEEGGNDKPTDNPNDEGGENKPADNPNDDDGENNGEDKPTDNPNDNNGENKGEDKPADTPNDEGGEDENEDDSSSIENPENKPDDPSDDGSGNPSGSTPDGDTLNTDSDNASDSDQDDDAEQGNEDSMATYTPITTTANLAAGTYYLGGYQGSTLHLVSYGEGDRSGHYYTAPYTYDSVSGTLTPQQSAQAIKVTLEATSGSNCYYIRFDGEGYLSATSNTAGKLIFTPEPIRAWRFTTSDGGFVVIQDDSLYVKLIISKRATDRLLRSIDGYEEGNPIVLFHQN